VGAQLIGEMVPRTTGVAIIVTGILRATLALPLLRLSGLHCVRAAGLEAGVTGHGIGGPRSCGGRESQRIRRPGHGPMWGDHRDACANGHRPVTALIMN
jgi:LrgB-like family protein